MTGGGGRSRVAETQPRDPLRPRLVLNREKKRFRQMENNLILAELLRLRGELDALIGHLRPVLRDADADLRAAIVASTGDQAFAAGGLWTASERLRAAAKATGQTLPDLPDAIDAANVHSSVALGRWLARQPTAERLGRDEAGVLWMLRPDDGR